MHQTLYRKYRSKDFSEIRGQDQVVKALKGSIKSGQFSHAFLFSGSRGTGKTSVARIFAKEIGTTETDLYEIDAASNRGIDEVRELKEAVFAMPYESKYKVYIIDEVHMLTTPAFNALLKTLEEPPSHAVFILATTEFDKLPDTIVSRCEVHRFKRASKNDLAQLVRDVAKKEGFSIDPSADDLTAIIAEGSFRDALGVLQKVMRSVSGKTIKREDVEEVTGAPKSEMVNDFIESIHSENALVGLKSLRAASESNVDMKTFLSLVLDKIRAALLLRALSYTDSDLEDRFLEDDVEKIKTWAKGKTVNSKVLKRLLETEREIAYATIPHLPLEIVLIESAEERDGEQPKLLNE